MAYLISCSACAFQEVVRDEGDVLSHKERHEEEYGSPHTVEVETVEEQPMFRGGDSDHW